MTQRFLVLLVLLTLRSFVPSLAEDGSSFKQVSCVYYSYYISNQPIHTILLKSQHYNTSAPACFGSHWYIREYKVVQNSASCFLRVAAENSSLCYIYVADRVVH